MPCIQSSRECVSSGLQTAGQHCTILRSTHPSVRLDLRRFNCLLYLVIICLTLIHIYDVYCDHVITMSYCFGTSNILLPFILSVMW